MLGATFCLGVVETWTLCSLFESQISNFPTARVASGARDQTHGSIAFAHLKPNGKKGGFTLPGMLLDVKKNIACVQDMNEHMNC